MFECGAYVLYAAMRLVRAACGMAHAGWRVEDGGWRMKDVESGACRMQYAIMIRECKMRRNHAAHTKDV
jgi:hypothetical protein